MAALNVGGFQLRINTPQALNPAASIVLSFDTVDIDENGFFDKNNPTRVTIPYTGFYAFHADLKYADASPPQGDSAYFRINDGGDYQTLGGGYSIMLYIDRSTCPMIRYLKAGDYIELYSRSVITGDTVQAVFTGHFLG